MRKAKAWLMFFKKYVPCPDSQAFPLIILLTLNGVAEQKAIIIMKKLFHLLCLIAMLCSSLNASSETLYFWLGEKVIIPERPYNGGYSTGGSYKNHFTVTFNTSNRSIDIKLHTFFVGCDSITIYWQASTTNSTVIQERYYLRCNQVDMILYPTSLSMNIGDTEKLQWIFSDTPEYNAPSPKATFSSSNTGVATVDSTGNVMAVGPGSATITATTNYQTSATCQVTVFPSMATGLNLDQTTMDLNVGSTQKLTATILPIGMTNSSVSWTSSDESIATVDADGNVTGVNTGLASITASTTDGSNLSASCDVIVSLPQAGFIKLDLTELELVEDETAKLTAIVMPSGTAQRVSWTSSDPTVARVIGGTVYAIGWGECMITARSLDGSNITADCIVMVYPKRWPGDVNRDGTVNVKDITDLIDIVLNGN